MIEYVKLTLPNNVESIVERKVFENFLDSLQNATAYKEKLQKFNACTLYLCVPGKPVQWAVEVTVIEKVNLKTLKDRLGL